MGTYRRPIRCSFVGGRSSQKVLPQYGHDRFKKARRLKWSCDPGRGGRVHELNISSSAVSMEWSWGFQGSRNAPLDGGGRGPESWRAGCKGRRQAPCSMGAGRAEISREWFTGDTVTGANGVQCPEFAPRLGIQQGRSIPLASAADRRFPRKSYIRCTACA